MSFSKMLFWKICSEWQSSEWQKISFPISQIQCKVLSLYAFIELCAERNSCLKWCQVVHSRDGKLIFGIIKLCGTIFKKFLKVLSSEILLPILSETSYKDLKKNFRCLKWLWSAMKLANDNVTQPQKCQSIWFFKMLFWKIYPEWQSLEWQKVSFTISQI